jgi:hypothetical protein
MITKHYERRDRLRLRVWKVEVCVRDDDDDDDDDGQKRPKHVV